MAKKIHKLKDPSLLNFRVTSKVLGQLGTISEVSTSHGHRSSKISLNERNSPLLFEALLSQGVRTSNLLNDREVSLSINLVDINATISRLTRCSEVVGPRTVGTCKVSASIAGAPVLVTAARGQRKCTVVEDDTVTPPVSLSGKALEDLLHRLCHNWKDAPPKPPLWLWSHTVPMRSSMEQHYHVLQISKPKEQPVSVCDIPNSPRCLDRGRQTALCQRLSRPRTMDSVLKDLLIHTGKYQCDEPTREQDTSDPTESCFQSVLRPNLQMYNENLAANLISDNPVVKSSPLKAGTEAVISSIRGILSTLDPQFDQAISLHIQKHVIPCLHVRKTGAKIQKYDSIFEQSMRSLSEIQNFVPTQLCLVRLIQLAGWLIQSDT